MNGRGRAPGAMAAAAVLLLLVDAALLVAWLHRGDTAPPAAARAEGAEEQAPTQPPVAAVAPGAPAATTAGTRGPETAVANAAVTPAGAPLAMVFGHVRDTGGGDVVRGTVQLRAPGWTADAAVGDGTFAFPSVPEGVYTLRARAEDALPLERTVTVRAPHTRADVQLDSSWKLLVHARTPEGVPLMAAAREQLQARWFRGLAALAFPEPVRGDLPPSNRDDYVAGVGRFRGADVYRTENVLPRDSVGLLVLPPGEPMHVALLMRNVVLAQQRVEPGQTEVTFVLPVRELLARTATVRVRLVRPDGSPVRGAPVALNDGNASGGGRPTGDDGRVVLAHLKPGLLDLQVGRWHTPPIQVAVPAGADLDLGDVLVQDPAQLVLAVDGGTGPVRARATPLGLPARDGCRVGTRVLRSDGDPLQATVTAGRWGLHVVRGELAGVVEVDVLPGELHPPLTLRLQRGAMLRVRSRLAPAVGRLTVRSPRGVIVLDDELFENGETEVLVPPGPYEAEITIGHGAPERRSLTVGAAGAVLDVP